MPRFSLTMSAIRVTGTRRSKATLFMLSPRGAINSSLRISPGCTGFSFLLAMSVFFVLASATKWSVIVDDLDAVCVPVAPLETQAPLVVDTDAILPHPVPLQFLQACSGERSERAHFRRRVK